jgi:putative tricarboxylic transport membrane protein
MTSEPAAPQRAGAVPRYARIDVIGGAVMVFIAGLVWDGAIGLSVGKIIDFGPGAMPRALAAILFVAGAAVLLHGLFQRAEEAEAITVAVRPPAMLAMAIILFALFIRGGDFWFLSTPRLGLMVVGPVTVFIAGFATPEANPRELVVMAFGLTAAALLVFVDLLGVPIPVFPGIVEKAIPPSFGVDAAVRVVYAVYGLLTAGLFVTFFGLPEMRRG